MEPADDPGNAGTGRSESIARLVDDLRGARAAAKDAADEVIVLAHPELMPELGQELEKLRRVKAARAAAEAAGTTDAAPAHDVACALAVEWESAAAIQAPGYSILRELGRGGQAVVYLAIQLSTGRNVALKVMREGPLADERTLARFGREVRVLASLNHPNIVTIFDTGQTADGSKYIAMRFVGGCGLGEYMQDRRKTVPDDPSSLLRVFLKICAAVNAAHLKGIVHRDLKPSNIRIDENGEPQVLDFGLARTALDHVIPGGESAVSVTGEFLGSLPWSSPEQAEGVPDGVDVRTDVYSLGVILYQMLTGGKFPYEVVGNIRDVLNNIVTAVPTPPSKVAPPDAVGRQVVGQCRVAIHDRPVVNREIENIVLKALAKDRGRRYQSAGDLGRDIGNYLLGQQTAPGARQREGGPNRAGTMSGRGGMVAVCALIVGAIALGVWRSVPAPLTRPIDRTSTEAVAAQRRPATANDNRVNAADSSASRSPADARRVDLLKIVAPRRDGRHHGNWAVRDDLLVSHAPTGNELEFPYVPPAEYDFRVTFVVDNPKISTLMFFVPVGAHQIAWCVAARENTACGFDLIDGKDAAQNMTTKWARSWITEGRPCGVVLKVRRDHIEAYLDDSLICNYPTDYHEIGLRDWLMFERRDTIGVMFNMSDVKVRVAEVVEITGTGKSLR
jgi:serine/threonine protein kinase